MRLSTSLLLFAAGLAPAWSGTFSLIPSADTYISPYSELGGPDANHGNTVSLWEIYEAGDFRSNLLFQFDLSGYAGRTVTGPRALLYLPIDSVLSPHGQELHIHPVLVSWSEATVTWNNFGVAPGVSDGTDISAVFYDDGTPGGQQCCGVGLLIYALPISLVQSWIDAPSSNYGLLLRGYSQAGGSFGFTVDSRELGGGDPLRLVFDLADVQTSVPEPSALLLLSGGLAIIAWKRPRR